MLLAKIYLLVFDLSRGTYRLPFLSFSLSTFPSLSLFHLPFSFPLSLNTQLGAHDYFGEIALLVDAPRTATVRSIETTTVLVSNRHRFQDLMAPIKEEITKTRKTELQNAVISNVSLFQPLSKLEQLKLIDVMGSAQYVKKILILFEYFIFLFFSLFSFEFRNFTIKFYFARL